MESLPKEFSAVGITLGCGIIGIAIYRLIFSKVSKIPIPCVQGGTPIFGQVFTMLKGSPWDRMSEWVEKYGTVYQFHLFGSWPFVIADPEVLKVVLSTKLSQFKKDTEWTYHPFMVLLGKGLVTAEGNSWRTQRTLLAAHMRTDLLDEIPAISFDAVNRLCVKLDEAKRTGAAVEMAEEFRRLTLHVITGAVLSLSPEESDRTFAHMYLPIVEEGNLRIWDPSRMYLPTPAWFKFRRDVAKLNDYVVGLIEKRMQLRKSEESAANGSHRQHDILDRLLGALTEEQIRDPTTISDIRDQIKTFILAGHETSASMLSWSLYELSRDCNKGLLEKIRSEAKTVYKGHTSKSNSSSGDNSDRFCVTSMPARSVLDGLQYAECCLRESLRKYAVVPSVVRTAVCDCDANGYLIPKGSTVMVSIQGVHHNPKYWPEPFEYKPERFLTEITPYTFLPFVEGPRTCIGQFLSLLETKIVLSTLLSRYSFEITNKEDAGEKHPFMVPIIPKTGHFMKIS